MITIKLLKQVARLGIVIAYEAYLMEQATKPKVPQPTLPKKGTSNAKAR